MTTPATTPLNIFVTVGMSQFPFDRLMGALESIVDDHSVFAQIGASNIEPRCEFARYIDPDELELRISQADVIITHAGNTVRQVQRWGKAPIVVPRREALGEMSNDHQKRFVEFEAHKAPMVVLDDDLQGLSEAVSAHAQREARLLEERVVPPATQADDFDGLLRPVITDTSANPLANHPTRRFSWAFAQLAHLAGTHLDLGGGYGDFAAALEEHSPRSVICADVATDKVHDNGVQLRSRVELGNKMSLPLRDAAVSSVSMLDVLEHVWDEDAVLQEVHRVLESGGSLVVTVPRHHWLSILDPDNVKYRAPRFHKAVYSARFGKARYYERFGDTTDGMQGDLATERGWHTNYRADDLFATLERNGFDVVEHDAANLFWRFFDIPRLFLPEKWEWITHGALRLDAKLFHQANLFVRAERR